MSLPKPRKRVREMTPPKAAGKPHAPTAVAGSKMDELARACVAAAAAAAAVRPAARRRVAAAAAAAAEAAAPAAAAAPDTSGDAAMAAAAHIAEQEEEKGEIRDAMDAAGVSDNATDSTIAPGDAELADSAADSSCDSDEHDGYADADASDSTDSDKENAAPLPPPAARRHSGWWLGSKPPNRKRKADFDARQMVCRCVCRLFSPQPVTNRCVRCVCRLFGLLTSKHTNLRRTRGLSPAHPQALCRPHAVQELMTRFYRSFGSS